ncbi:MAG TPA: ferredoxin family protein [Gemmataceae bacterium]|nr:ferredoxin family protein [Gemmataceae bacterium]
MIQEFCVVTRPCHDCKYTDCVTICPVDCFYQDEKMLYIHPDECIDCGACIDECPVSAIFHAPDVPAEWASDIALNQERAEALRAAGSANLTEKLEPLEGPTCKRA